MNLLDRIEGLRTPLKITEVRYGTLGKLVLRLDNGTEFTIKEPMDVLLVDQPLNLVSAWANKHYGLFF